MLARAAAGQTPLWIGWSHPARDGHRALGAPRRAARGRHRRARAHLQARRVVARERSHRARPAHRGLEQERARTHAEAVAQSEKWQAEQAAARERSRMEAKPGPSLRGPRRQGPVVPRPDRRAEASLDSLFKPQGARGRRANSGATADPGEADGARRRPHAAPSADARGTPERRHERPRRQGSPPRKATRERAALGGASHAPGPRRGAPRPRVIEKGARVRVRTGALRGQGGIVGELDWPGGARVLLGLSVDAPRRERPRAVPRARAPGAPKLAQKAAPGGSSQDQVMTSPSEAKRIRSVWATNSGGTSAST
jgi:hypothetical protein